MKKYTFIGFFILIDVLALFWLAINFSINYVDVTSMCRIKLNGDMLRGNEETIKSALKYIKENKRSSYDDACKYIDNISERYCIDADYHLDALATQAGWKRPGCYIRGSKTMYLKPESAKTDIVIKQRADEIIKDAQFSKNYWEANER